MQIPRKKHQKTFIDCPICGEVNSKWLFTHIKDNHDELYNQIMETIKKLFYDSNFVQDHIDQYKDVLYGINYTSVYTQWKKIYGEETVSQRTTLLKYPQYLDINNRQTLNNIPSTAHDCSICGEQNVSRIMNHIKFKHPEQYNQLIQDCEAVFYDAAFTDKSNIRINYLQLYGISYNTIKRQWIKNMVNMLLVIVRKL